ncbi:MAG: selenocysteine-specific translation elongation factor [Deltaproteobacteria bacterium]|nr:selenocysteine-specific translation elongation factor [Deltaproteobacteria bacterium]
MSKFPFIIGTAGHIDHGKTSLIKALTGMDTDRLKEEKERGISIDLGFAYLDLPDGAKAGIVDVPGHERFIKNMLAGATGFDMVLFVVAADDGIMPQTREHLDILRLLRMNKGVFVLTKTDLVDERCIHDVSLAVRKLIANTCLKDSPIIPVSSATRSGIDDLKNLIAREAQHVLPRQEGGFFRLPIDRCFAVKGFGAVVTGTVASGRIRKDDHAAVLPQGIKVRARGMQSHKRDVEEISSGQRAAVNLAGISHHDMQRGDLLAAADFTQCTALADVELEFLDSPDRTVKNHAVLKLHHLTKEANAKVVFAGRDAACAGEKIFGKIRLSSPFAMLRGDRFILRDFAVNKTVGGGRVLLPFNALDKKDIDGYRILAGDNLAAVMMRLLSGRDFGMNRRFLRMQLNRKEDALASLVADSGTVKQFGDYLVLAERVDEVGKNLIQILTALHETKPEEAGLAEDALLKEIGKKIPLPVFREILEEMIAEGIIERDKGNIWLKGRKKKFEQSNNQIEDEMVHVFQTKGFNPPKMDELKGLLRSTNSKKTFDILVKKGKLVKIAEDAYLAKDTLEQAKAMLAEFIAKNNKIKAAEFRDLLGCGRKFAIELLEYFDKERLTLRSGDYRVLRKKING